MAMTVDFRVYLITDRQKAAGGDILRAVEGALDGGIVAVQLREKDLPGGDLYRLAERMRSLTARYGARLLVNDRVDVALAVGADGVHLGTKALPASAARGILGTAALIGCSTHDLRELRQAQDQGADFVTFGPVFPTPSKAAYGDPVGVAALFEACRKATIPVFALGGMGTRNASQAINAGAHGIALISEIIAAADPRGTAAKLLARFGSTLAAGQAARETPKEGEP